jgi:sec-independent protein translocase protein TatC
MTEEREEGLQMSFLEHLDELRRRLIHSVLAIAIAFGVCFYFSDVIYNFLARPIKAQLLKARQQERAPGGPVNLTQLPEGAVVPYTFAEETIVNGVRIASGATIRIKVQRTLEGKLTAVTAEPWVIGKTVIPGETMLPGVFGQGEVAPGFEEEGLIITRVQGGFTLYMQVALYAAVAFAIPFLLYQIWAFIAPGLYRHEKKYLLPLLFMATAFFVLGATFAYTIAFPAACDYLLNVSRQGGIRPLITADEYFDLIVMIMLGLGIVFQIPTIAFLLARIGLVTPRLLWRAWRYAVVLIAILAAVLTPTADAFNMLVFAAPMLALYFLSIGIVWLFGKPRRSDAEVRALAHSK